MDRQTEFVLRAVEERNVKFIRLWFTDVQGFLKSVAMAPAELEGAFAEGTGFDGSAIEGYARVFESDMIARPDPTTFQLLPWRTEASTARMFCDIALPDGSPAMADPRHVLKSALNKAADMGFTFYCHPEIEFFLFKKPIIPGQMPEPLDMAGYFDHTTMDDGTDFRRDTVMMLEQMGISVEFSHHETAHGQHEIDLRYADALSMADNIMTFRVVVREIAAQQNILASFMPKPFTDMAGSGMHTHMSLFEGDRNAFYDATDEVRLSKIGRQFVAGLLAHSAEITAVTNQWVNSYKRLVGGGEGPRLRLLGPQQPLGAHPGAAVQAQQAVGGTHRIPRHRLGVQSLSGLRPHAQRRPGRHHPRTAPARRGRGRRVGAVGAGTPGTGHHSPAALTR